MTSSFLRFPACNLGKSKMAPANFVQKDRQIRVSNLTRTATLILGTANHRHFPYRFWLLAIQSNFDHFKFNIYHYFDCRLVLNDSKFMKNTLRKKCFLATRTRAPACGPPTRITVQQLIQNTKSKFSFQSKQMFWNCDSVELETYPALCLSTLRLNDCTCLKKYPTPWRTALLARIKLLPEIQSAYP